MGWANLLLNAVFTVEVVVMIIWQGFRSYMQDLWNKMDLAIVIFSALDSAAGFVGGPLRKNSNFVVVVTCMKALRALRPLRLLKRAESLRRVGWSVVTLVRSLGVSLVFGSAVLYVFSILGLNAFLGALGRCRGDVLRSRSECLSSEGLTWESAANNFDWVGASFLTVLSLTARDSWAITMFDGLISTGKSGSPPEEGAQPAALSFYLAAVGCWWILLSNMFVGILMKAYQEGVEEYRRSELFNLRSVQVLGGSLGGSKVMQRFKSRLLREEAAANAAAAAAREARRRTVAAGGAAQPQQSSAPAPVEDQPKPRREDLPRLIDPPQSAPRRLSMWLCSSPPFDALMQSLAVVAVGLFSARVRGASRSHRAALDAADLFLLFAFSFEAALRMHALHPRGFFRSPWDVYNVVVVLLSLFNFSFVKVLGSTSVGALVRWQPQILRSAQLLRTLSAISKSSAVELIYRGVIHGFGEFLALAALVAVLAVSLASMMVQLFAGLCAIGDENEDVYGPRCLLTEPESLLPTTRRFSNMAAALLALLTISTENWVDLMHKSAVMAESYPRMPGAVDVVITLLQKRSESNSSGERNELIRQARTWLPGCVSQVEIDAIEASGALSCRTMFLGSLLPVPCTTTCGSNIAFFIFPAVSFFVGAVLLNMVKAILLSGLKHAQAFSGNRALVTSKLRKKQFESVVGIWFKRRLVHAVPRLTKANGRCRLTVVQVTGLENDNAFGSLDVYFTAILSPFIRKSMVKSGTLEPSWENDEDMLFLVKNLPATLCIRVYDRDDLHDQDSLLGICNIGLSDYIVERRRPSSRGHLCIVERWMRLYSGRCRDASIKIIVDYITVPGADDGESDEEGDDGDQDGVSKRLHEPQRPGKVARKHQFRRVSADGTMITQGTQLAPAIERSQSVASREPSLPPPSESEGGSGQASHTPPRVPSSASAAASFVRAPSHRSSSRDSARKDGLESSSSSRPPALSSRVAHGGAGAKNIQEIDGKHDWMEEEEEEEESAGEAEKELGLIEAILADRLDVVRELVIGPGGGSTLLASCVAESGDTALHIIAASESNIPLARFLLENGANPSVRNHEGARPTDLARAAGCRGMVLLLRQWERKFKTALNPAAAKKALDLRRKAQLAAANTSPDMPKDGSDGSSVVSVEQSQLSPPSIHCEENVSDQRSLGRVKDAGDEKIDGGRRKQYPAGFRGVLSEAAELLPPTAAQLRLLAREGVPAQYLPTTRPAASRLLRHLRRPPAPETEEQIRALLAEPVPPLPPPHPNQLSTGGKRRSDKSSWSIVGPNGAGDGVLAAALRRRDSAAGRRRSSAISTATAQVLAHVSMSSQSATSAAAVPAARAAARSRVKRRSSVVSFALNPVTHEQLLPPGGTGLPGVGHGVNGTGSMSAPTVKELPTSRMGRNIVAGRRRSSAFSTATAASVLAAAILGDALVESSVSATAARAKARSRVRRRSSVSFGLGAVVTSMESESTHSNPLFTEGTGLVDEDTRCNIASGGGGAALHDAAALMVLGRDNMSGRRRRSSIFSTATAAAVLTPNINESTATCNAGTAPRATTRSRIRRKSSAVSFAIGAATYMEWEPQHPGTGVGDMGTDDNVESHAGGATLQIEDAAALSMCRRDSVDGRRRSSVVSTAAGRPFLRAELVHASNMDNPSLTSAAATTAAAAAARAAATRGCRSRRRSSAVSYTLMSAVTDTKSDTLRRESRAVYEALMRRPYDWGQGPRVTESLVAELLSLGVPEVFIPASRDCAARLAISMRNVT